MNNLIDKMKNLISELNKATVAYDAGATIMTDKSWDDKYFQLKELEDKTGIILNNSPTNKIIFETVSQLEKVTHDTNNPMLSLNKTKDINDIINFTNEHPSIVMFKMDGLSCRLIYENGELISAATRGNGYVGENILHNIKCVRNIPSHIPYKNRVIIDGEIICPVNEVPPEYKNARNFAAGSIRLLNSKESASRNLKFIAWDFIKGDNGANTLSEKLEELNKIGFECTDFYLIDNLKSSTENTKQETIEYIINDLKKNATELFYPIDGLVFKWDKKDDYDYAGITSHHPLGALAFKFYDESYPTSLLNIEWSLGRTGQITPIAICKEIEIDGTSVSRCSLHNISVMKDTLNSTGWIGQNVSVAKMNMIIPQIVDAESEPPQNVKFFEIPDVCPIWGNKTTIKSNNGIETLWCENPNCEGKFLNQLIHFVGKKGLDIKGISEAILNDLITWKWVECKNDLFNLARYRDQWIMESGYGVISVDKILSSIDSVKNNCSLEKFISSLGIPLIGITVSKDIAKRCGSYKRFRELIDDENFSFEEWDGFGEAMNHAIKDYDFTEADALAAIICPTVENKEQRTEDLIGKVFCITGKLKLYKNRAELVSEIESRGGKVTGSVSKNTNYLINNDIESTTEKNIKAKSLNIPILTEEDFKNL